MGLVLGLIGFDMVEAADGQEALALVRERRPPLLVLDAMMPRMHGFDVCAAVKSDPATSDTCVVFCSAVYRGTVAGDARIAFGADGFLQKPFRLEEAAAALRAALSGPPDAETDAAAIEAASAAWHAAVAALKERRDDEALTLCRQAVVQDPALRDEGRGAAYAGFDIAGPRGWVQRSSPPVLAGVLVRYRGPARLLHDESRDES